MLYSVNGILLLWLERRDTLKLGDEVLFVFWFENGRDVDGVG